MGDLLEFSGFKDASVSAWTCETSATAAVRNAQFFCFAGERCGLDGIRDKEIRTIIRERATAGLGALRSRPRRSRSNRFDLRTALPRGTRTSSRTAVCRF